MRVKFHLEWGMVPQSPKEDATEEERAIFETKMASLRERLSLVTGSPIEGVNAYMEYEGNLELIAQKLPGAVIKGETSANALQSLHEAIIQMKEDLKGWTPERQFNDRCSVHIPGLGLLEVRTVNVFADACTDSINDLLKEGWRILAICPQPNKRRPDYVMGHTDPEARP